MRTPVIAFGLYLLGAVLGAGWAVAHAPSGALWHDARATPATPPDAPGATDAAHDGEAGLRVLLLGNSYLLENELPAMIAALARADGRGRVDVEVDCPGAFTLERHVAAGRYRERLREGRFDLVVLQDQSQRPTLSAEARERQMFAPARTLAEAIRAAGARVALFTTWARQNGDFQLRPDDSYEAMQDRAVTIYGELAESLHALRIPAGDVWQRVHRARPDLELWKADGSHPSLLGSYVAACAFHAAVFGRSVSGTSYTAGVEPDAAAAVHAAVDAWLADQQTTKPRLGPVPAFVAVEGGACPEAYAQDDGVCVHEALEATEAERQRLLISFKAGLGSPVVQP